MGALPVLNARLHASAREGGKARCDSQSILSLTLGAIRVDGGGRETHVEQVIVDEVRGLLGLDEDESAGWWHGDQEIIQSLLLCVALNPDNLLESAKKQ